MTITKRIIYSTPEGGVAIVTPVEPLPIEEIAIKCVPPGIPFEIVEIDIIPTDRTFRNAWVMGDCCINHNIDKCKEIGHTIRRTKRAEEFAPYDEVIAKQIPGKDAGKCEESRQIIRDKYAAIQDSIDAAETPDEIKSTLGIAS